MIAIQHIKSTSKFINSAEPAIKSAEPPANSAGAPVKKPVQLNTIYARLRTQDPLLPIPIQYAYLR